MKQKSLFLAIAVLLGLRITATAQTPPAYVPTDGLVGWWPFNGNANDESGNGNNGTVNGATLTEDRFGDAGKAYSFDGSSNQISGSAATFPLGNSSRSISAWAYKTGFPTLTFANTIFLYGVNSPGGWFAQINGNPSDIFTIGLSQSGVENDFHMHHAYTLDTWYHYTITYNIDTVKIYVNSQLVGSGVINPINTVSGNFYIGSAIIDSYFEGKLDDIGIWNRTLTQEEITDLYNANLCYEYITVTDTLIINLGPTGFNPVTYSNTILMYPNPSNDQLTIDYGDYATLAGYTLKIFNSIGQEIHAANINQQQEVLPLGTWGGAGNYQVVIYNAQGVPVDTRTIVLQ